MAQQQIESGPTHWQAAGLQPQCLCLALEITGQLQFGIGFARYLRIDGIESDHGL